MSKKIERLMNLIAYLSDTKIPRTLSEIIETIPGYNPNFEAARRAFERDKEELRSMGFDLIIEEHPYGDNGYRIANENTYFDLDLTPAQRNILQYALSIHSPNPNNAASLLTKIGGSEVGDDLPRITPINPPDCLSMLNAACSNKSPVSFRFLEQTRNVLPRKLIAKEGYWYLESIDLDKNQPRTFRVDRISNIDGNSDFEFEEQNGNIEDENISVEIEVVVHPKLKEQFVKTWKATEIAGSNKVCFRVARQEIFENVFFDYFGYIRIESPVELASKLDNKIDRVLDMLEN